MKVGDYRLIPKGTEIWSISLQERVIFTKDQVVKITNTIHGNDDSFFGILQLQLYMHMIPTLIDKTHGEISTSLSVTEKYKLPNSTPFIESLK